MNTKKMNTAHGSPYDRGESDSYYRRPASPHKGGVVVAKITTLTEQEVAEYNLGYNNNEAMGDFKDWE